jgi:hypothetical protein
MEQEQPSTAEKKQRPRWTKEEDEFLAMARRSGLSKKDIVAQYKLNFPGTNRPDAGIAARIPSFDRAHGRTPDSEIEPEPEDGEADYTIGDNVAEVYNLIAQGYPTEAERVLNSVAVLFGLTVRFERPAGEPTRMVPRNHS